MLHTTMSFHQIMRGLPQLLLAEDSRLKKAHIDTIRLRIYNRAHFHSFFDSESIRGMADINSAGAVWTDTNNIYFSIDDKTEVFDNSPSCIVPPVMKFLVEELESGATEWQTFKRHAEPHRE